MKRVKGIKPVLAALPLAVLLAACGEEPGEQVETLSVTRDDFTVSLVSRGELSAAESTPIQPPGGSRAARTVLWMAPNYSFVEAGDVVVRFDISSAEREANEAGIEIDKVDLQVLGKERELERMLSELGNDQEILDIEKVMAAEFDFENEMAYSRFEIIDAMRDRALLDYKSGHLEGKKDLFSDRQGAEVAVLAAQRTTQKAKFDEQQVMLQNSEVIAPHDGYFVAAKNWWGQPIDVGSTVFAGTTLANIPNLDRMQGTLYVLESEAVGIVPGQAVDVIVDAFPDRPLTGKVSSISAVAAPIERDSPVNYFEVTVDLDQSDPEWIIPGSIITATIHINRVEDTIAVPNQAIFREGEQNWVLLSDGGDLVRRDVRLGVRGPNRSEVVDGLQSGDEIALFPPENPSS